VFGNTVDAISLSTSELHDAMRFHRFWISIQQDRISRSVFPYIGTLSKECREGVEKLCLFVTTVKGILPTISFIFSGYTPFSLNYP
jgi:hypothetical protein